MHPPDHDLQRRITAALAHEVTLDVAHIGVAVRHGVVTLSGHVGSAAQRSLAERLAREVPGIRAVAEHLEVRAADVAKTADDEIADRAVRILSWDLGLPQGFVQVTVSRGVVELDGAVDSEYERRQAEHDIRQLHGVRDVVNRIRLRDWRDMLAEATVGAPIEHRQMRVYADGDGTVVLEGRVRTQQERLDAEAAVRAAPGVLRVENRLIVEPRI
ncbi:BON domain-containing protein [Solimonas variicoloris]|uniref:BON domain-containing protein n=1 Tax=Solimonas variicoloris TaxID=254408 RepID=UPI00038013BC|nr:BON domain-containing protein [Solimonas variicoloris]